MPDKKLTVRLRSDHAAFLVANLARMAQHTRDAMKPPSLPKERRDALYSRAILLEYIDDAIRGALAEADPVINAQAILDISHQDFLECRSNS